MEEQDFVPAGAEQFEGFGQPVNTIKTIGEEEDDAAPLDALNNFPQVLSAIEVGPTGVVSRRLWLRISRWLALARGGTNARTPPPMISDGQARRNRAGSGQFAPGRARRVRAYSYLVGVLIPKPIEPLASIAMMAWRLISSSYCLMT